jgi:VRR-NUC domain
MRRKIVKEGSEASVQMSIVKYLRFQYPFALYSATAGGVKTSFMQSARLKMTGYVAGVPDLLIFEPCNGFHGLMIEVKKDSKSYATKEQKEWIKKLNERNYKAHVCKSFEDAKNIIDQYFDRSI